MSVFIPNLILNDVTYIDEKLLKEHNIKGLILDVDNTLASHGSQELLEHIKTWLDSMKKLGIKLIIVSNNKKKRVEPFANKLELEFISMAFKPTSNGFVTAKSALKLNTNEIAVVGDQIFTDITGGNRSSMFTILVTPIELENGRFFKFKRKIENIFINKYNKQNKQKTNTK